MKVALAGPVRVHDLRPWLDLDDDAAASLPEGQGGTSSTQLARGLLRRGVDLVVVSLDDSLVEEKVLEGPGLRLRLGPMRTRARTRDAFRTERRYLAAALAEEDPDVVNAHWSYEYALASLATGRPTVVTVRDWAPTMLRMNPDPYRVVRLGMSAAAVARARWLTVPSPYLRGRLERWTRRPVALTPNALDDHVFERMRDGRDRPGAVLVAVNSHFQRRKNVTTLLEAFTAVREAEPSTELRLVGVGYESGGPAQRWAAARGLDAGVRFVGPLAHGPVLDEIQDADVFVHPSLEESFGMVLLEAMAQRVPVVGGARSGAVPWVLDEGRAGVLVDVTSAAAVARGVVELLRDDARRKEVADAGFARAWETFRLGQVVDTYVDVYRRAAEGATS